MNENQKKWLLYLQGKGVMFEYSNMTGAWVKDKEWAFTAAQKCYCIHAQSIPDIPDWRELCWEMQEKGVMFESICRDGSWESRRSYFFPDYMHKTDYRIPNQSIPEWREEMTEETKPDQREEIPHRELQIQWHEDMLHHLRTDEPMRMWEWKKKSDGTWAQTIEPGWDAKTEYRRKPRTVTYWHCVGWYADSGGKKDTVYFASGDRNDVLSETERYKERFQLAKFSPITETTVELED